MIFWECEKDSGNGKRCLSEVWAVPGVSLFMMLSLPSGAIQLDSDSILGLRILFFAGIYVL